MDTTETPTEKKGISRRAVIQGGAVGAAAFWTVPVIDSIASRAAAGSIPGLCTPGPLSWAYYFYMDSSNVVHLVSLSLIHI